MVLAVRARGRTPDRIAQVVELSLAELAAHHAHTAAVVAARCRPDDMTAVAEALQRFEPKSYVLPDEPLLEAPTVAEMQQAVNGTLISGDEAMMSRECMSVLVCGMTAPNVLERLTEGQAVVAPADRDDVVLAVTCAHGADSYPSLSCLILNGALKMHPAIAKLVSGLRLRLPIIATTTGTFETAIAAASARGRVTPASPRKIDTAVALVERHVNIADLLGVRLAPIPIPTVITPQMFTHQLLDRARADRKRIVLPEGSTASCGRPGGCCGTAWSI